MSTHFPTYHKAALLYLIFLHRIHYCRWMASVSSKVYESYEKMEPVNGIRATIPAGV